MDRANQGRQKTHEVLTERGVLRPHTLEQLLQDTPTKRRKVYFEFCETKRHELLETLNSFGFDTQSLTWRNPPPPFQGVSCLTIGSVRDILRFLVKNSDVTAASVDFPEYKWQ